MRRQRGQGTVELVALAPLLVVAVLGLVQVLLAGRAALQAERAAGRAAVAAAIGADPVEAARRAAPAGTLVDVVRGGVRVRVPLRAATSALGAPAVAASTRPR